ncbi:MAG: sigma-70 family RNA polymerase sigma factor [Bacteroidetes bacterium]|nr:sigma-70 family RNA polymerase sigma factor [Bacteroidota bacterium]
MLRSFKTRKVKHTATIHLTDAQLIDIYVSEGNNDHFGELFERYTHLVFGVCMKYLKNEDEAEDAVMNIFEKLITDLKTQEVRDFKNWLYRVAKNHCLMTLRKKGVKYRAEKEIFRDKQQEFMEILYEGHHLYEEDEEAGILISLHNAMGKLKEEQRKCLEMMYLEKKSYNEIASATAYSLKQVKSYIQNGKRNLKNMLSAK